ncbi:MAG: zwf, glucose-6-phosphate 1-dehydrogenase [Parcubacteria group bacterium]|nr:zwf, glucose-6-phosphate 1-dehydrogenase [Parcubacteria group bacterium]
MATETPLILIIVGITGDLAKRKLLPAIAAIHKAGLFPAKFRVLGVTRQSDVSTDDLLSELTDSTYMKEHLSLLTMDVLNTSDYIRLTSELAEIERGWGGAAQRLFYLSVPPLASEAIIEHLGTSGLAAAPDTKLLIEKPFGFDQASAAELVTHIDKHFTSSQVYRIDHYLAKEMAQNLIVFRERNPLFRGTWNKDCIERIEISAIEEIGIEGRSHFYEQTGALRDLVQSHLLQLAALILMPLPQKAELREIPGRRLRALQSLRLSDVEPVRRGQYIGYRDEVRNPSSSVETFVAFTLISDDPFFIGVPVTLMTGKRMGKKATEVRVVYKTFEEKGSNTLVLRLQPNEGVSLSLYFKRPGYTSAVEERTFDFSYASSTSVLAEAYEKVLVDAISGDHDLFVSSDEVLESWRIIAPIQEAWAMSSGDLTLYEPGSDPTVS